MTASRQPMVKWSSEGYRSSQCELFFKQKKGDAQTLCIGVQLCVSHPCYTWQTGAIPRAGLDNLVYHALAWLF